MVKVCPQRVKWYLTVSCWITLGLISLALLAACGISQTTSPTAQAIQKKLPTAAITVLPSKPVKTSLPPTPTQASPQPAVTVDLQRQLIQFWYVREAGAEDLAQKLVEEFNKTNRWGIRVEAVPHASSGVMDEALSSALQEKKLPALLAGYSHDLQYWNAAGILLADLQAYTEDPAWGLSSSDKQDFYPVIWTQDVLTQTGTTQNAVRFGLPWYRTGLVMLYNQSWAKELGFNAPPTTPSQFRQQACAAAKANREDADKENNGTGGWLIDRQPSALLSWIFAFGGQVEQSGQQGYQFDSPGSADALTYIHELYTQGCAWWVEELDRHETFANRQALFTTESLQDLVEQQASFRQAGSQDAWMVLPFPSRQGGSLDVFGPSLAVLKSTSEKQLAAWLFARWLVSPENQARWVLSSGTLPTRDSVLPLLKGEPGGSSQWKQALGLLPYAHVEPAFASWRTLRWSLGDVLSQMLSPGFKGSQIPALLKSLDKLAEEVQAQGR